MPERKENCKNKQSVILTTIECRKEERIVKNKQSVILTTIECRKEERIVKNKQSVILTTIECRKEEKIVKKQIVSNTNHNRMPERNVKKTNSQ